VSGAAPGDDGPQYWERLWPAPWVWASALVLGVMFALVLVPLTPVTVVVAGGVLVSAALGAGLVATTPGVGVRDGRLFAGRAQIDVRHLGTITELDAAGIRHEHGPGLDLRAYLCVRSWIPSGLRIELTDPQDPAPYWLISTRRPHRLAAALTAARRAAA